MFHKLIIVILLATLTSACAQQAAFVSTPPGAQVFIDGQEIGMTPCAFDYKSSKTESHEVTITKDGYDSVNFVVISGEVDTEARGRWLAAGAVWSPLWVGTFFTNKLKDTYDFALRAEPLKLTATAKQIEADKSM